MKYDSAGRLLVKKYDLAYMKNRKDSFGGNYNEKRQYGGVSIRH